MQDDTNIDSSPFDGLVLWRQTEGPQDAADRWPALGDAQFEPTTRGDTYLDSPRHRAMMNIRDAETGRTLHTFGDISGISPALLYRSVVASERHVLIDTNYGVYVHERR